MGREKPFAIAAVLALAGASPMASAAEAARPVAVGVKLVPETGGAALTFDLSRPVDAQAYTLGSPDRIVVDLPEVVFQIDPNVGEPESARGAPPVKAFRFGRLAPGKSRVVIDLDSRACPERAVSKPIFRRFRGVPADDRNQALRRRRVCGGGEAARRFRRRA